MSTLFKITMAGKSSHLYVTCHISINSFSVEAKQAFEQSSCLLLETSFEEQAKIETFIPIKVDDWHKKNGITPDEAFMDYLNAMQIEKIVALLVGNEQLKSSAALRVLTCLKTSPIFLCTIITNIITKKTGLIEGKILDSQLEEQAKLLKKPIVSLDTAEDLAERLVGFNIDYKAQREFAKYSLDELLSADGEEKLKTKLNTIITLYLAGKMAELSLFIESLNSLPSEKEYYQTTIVERDSSLAHAMVPFLKTGNAFIAVGAGHLAGILELLEKMGCTIEPIIEGERLYAIHTLSNTTNAEEKSNRFFDSQLNCRVSRKLKAPEDLLPLRLLP